MWCDMDQHKPTFSSLSYFLRQDIYDKGLQRLLRVLIRPGGHRLDSNLQYVSSPMAFLALTQYVLPRYFTTAGS